MSNDKINLAKEAYILSQQLLELENAMSKEAAVSGYSSYATNYNMILEKSKKVLGLDDVLLSTVAHLSQYDAYVETGYRREFEQIKADISVLKATLRAYFDFNFPKKEKEKIGFGGNLGHIS